MLLTFIVTLLNLIMFYCAIFPILNKKMIIYAILFFLKHALLILNLVKISVKNTVWSEKHLKLVLQLQNINRLLRNPNDIFVYLKNVIVFMMTVDFAIFSIIIMAKFIVETKWNFSGTVLFLFTVILDTEMINVIVLTLFFAFKIKKWNRLVIDNMSFEENVNEQDEAAFTNTMFQTFNELLDGYHLMGQLFGSNVSNARFTSHKMTASYRKAFNECRINF